MAGARLCPSIGLHFQGKDDPEPEDESASATGDEDDDDEALPSDEEEEDDWGPRKKAAPRKAVREASFARSVASPRAHPGACVRVSLRALACIKGCLMCLLLQNTDGMSQAPKASARSRRRIDEDGSDEEEDGDVSLKRAELGLRTAKKVGSQLQAADARHGRFATVRVLCDLRSITTKMRLKPLT